MGKCEVIKTTIKISSKNNKTIKIKIIILK